MNFYTAILFVHSISVLVITSPLTMEAWMLIQLRRTVHPDDAQSLTTIVPLIGISAIGSLVSIYTTERISPKAFIPGSSPGLVSPLWRSCFTLSSVR